jgi:hypothetical protein
VILCLRLLLVFLLLFVLPLALHAAWWLTREHPESWSQANWGSAGLLPAASARPEAMLHVYCGRVGRWRGVFAHHCWIVVKERDAPAYTRYDVVGWGMPVRRNAYPPDGRWFGGEPERVGVVEGEAAEALVPKVHAAVAAYPWRRMGDYAAWPGPNSNSFANFVLAAVPEADIALPPTALGKDFRADGVYAGLTPSHSGVQIAWRGFAAISLGWVEGFEVNILGAVAGLDWRRPALKLPGFGRIGVDPGGGLGPARAAAADQR